MTTIRKPKFINQHRVKIYQKFLERERHGTLLKSIFRASLGILTISANPRNKIPKIPRIPSAKF